MLLHMALIHNSRLLMNIIDIQVKVVVQFKGREMQHKELGHELLMKLFQPLVDVAAMEGTPKIEGRSMTMLVGPKRV